MKKWFSILLCLVLAGSFLFTSIGTVQADAIDPTVTPISGNTKFSTVLVPFNDLPGATTTADGLVVPAGFPVGEKQFEGAGVLVSDFTYGTAKACFPITAVNQGWGGKVGMLDGTKWDLLDTTITTPNESSYSWACATISSNGTYTLITWVADPSKLPTAAACGYDISFAYGYASSAELFSTYEKGFINSFTVYSTKNLAGKSLTVSLIKSTPAGSYVWNGSAKGVLVSAGANVYTMVVSPTVPYTWYFNTQSEVWHLNFGSCTQDVTNADGLI
jgi:hypothetical protein